MRKLIFSVFVTLALINAIGPSWAEDKAKTATYVAVNEEQTSSAPPATNTQVSEPPTSQTRDGIENAAREVPILKSRVVSLEKAINKAHKRGNTRAVNRLQREQIQARLDLVRLRGRVASVEANPLGGRKGQKKLWSELHKAGIISGGQVNAKIAAEIAAHNSAKKAEVKKEVSVTPARGETDMLVLTVMVAILIAGLIGAIIWLLATRGGGAQNGAAAWQADQKATGIPDFSADGSKRKVRQNIGINGRILGGFVEVEEGYSPVTPVQPPVPAVQPAPPVPAAQAAPRITVSPVFHINGIPVASLTKKQAQTI